MRFARGYWTVDFGPYTSLAEAEQYVMPFEYVKNTVYPERLNNNRDAYREKWWIYAEARVGMRNALIPLNKYIATPRVAKHRVFVWINHNIMCNDAMIVMARDDDYFFGVLHSYLHELWSLRMGTSLEDRPRYTPTTTFETFPFPWSPAHEDTGSPAYQAISTAARQLHEERQVWLDVGGKERTLTNLYNALNVWRGKEKMKVKDDAADFAPRLDVLHETLDRAVCDAYGWPYTILQDDDEILRLLLELNLERSAG